MITNITLFAKVCIIKFDLVFVSKMANADAQIPLSHRDPNTLYLWQRCCRSDSTISWALRLSHAMFGSTNAIQSALSLFALWFFGSRSFLYSCFPGRFNLMPPGLGVEMFLSRNDYTPLQTPATRLGTMVWDSGRPVFELVAVRLSWHYLILGIDLLCYFIEFPLVECFPE